MTANANTTNAAALTLDKAADLLCLMLQARIPTFLWGAPGIGKSDVVRQTAKQLGRSLIDFRAVLREPVDMRGLPAPDLQNGTTRWLSPDELPRVDRDGETGILFMDELNAAPPSVQKACFGLVLDRQLGEYRLPDGWDIVAAGNRQSDRAAAERMPSALANRFAHIEAIPDVDVWARYANSAQYAPEVIAFVRFRRELLHNMQGTDLRAFPSPRSWERVSKIMMADPPKELRLPAVTANVGAGPAGEFEAFMLTWAQLPDLDKIIADPEGARDPKQYNASTMYALSSALARKMTSENADQIAKYLSRMPREFEIITFIDAVKRDDTLASTKTFISWSTRNGDVIFG